MTSNRVENQSKNPPSTTGSFQLARLLSNLFFWVFHFEETKSCSPLLRTSFSSFLHASLSLSIFLASILTSKLPLALHSLGRPFEFLVQIFNKLFPTTNQNPNSPKPMHSKGHPWIRCHLPSQIWYGKDCCLCSLDSASNHPRRRKDLCLDPLPHSRTCVPNQARVRPI